MWMKLIYLDSSWSMAKPLGHVRLLTTITIRCDPSIPARSIYYKNININVIHAKGLTKYKIWAPLAFGPSP